MPKPTITITVSEGRSYKECQYLHSLQFRRALAPKLERRPLKLGSWAHFCLEHLYGDGSWRSALNELIRTDWDVLFDEEKEHYGDLPADVARLMEGYEAYWREDPWELVLDPEVHFDVRINTQEYIIRFLGRVDLVIRDRYGMIWCLDHKTALRIPDADNFRLMDTQLTAYPWAIQRQYGIDVTGTIYNYLRSKAPTVPHQNKDGSLSKAQIDTDERTFLAALQSYGLRPEDYPAQREAAKVSTDSFFLRARVPRDAKATQTTMLDLINTAIAKETYREPIRNVTFRCEQCSMLPICQAEFFGQDTSGLMLTHYKVLDNPYSYLGLKEEGVQ